MLERYPTDPREKQECIASHENVITGYPQTSWCHWSTSLFEDIGSNNSQVYEVQSQNDTLWTSTYLSSATADADLDMINVPYIWTVTSVSLLGINTEDYNITQQLCLKSECFFNYKLQQHDDTLQKYYPWFWVCVCLCVYFLVIAQSDNKNRF